MLIQPRTRFLRPLLLSKSVHFYRNFRASLLKWKQKKRERLVMLLQTESFPTPRNTSRTTTITLFRTLTTLDPWPSQPRVPRSPGASASASNPSPSSRKLCTAATLSKYKNILIPKHPPPPQYGNKRIMNFHGGRRIRKPFQCDNDNDN